MSIRADKVWHNGSLIDWDEAQVHVTSHALHYGTSWFEGIRCYKTRRGPEVFRLGDHLQRLHASCKIYRTEIGYSLDELRDGILETIRANSLDGCYVRPLIFRGTGAMGLNPLGARLEVFLMAWEWGTYLGENALEQGVDACISSWNRAAPNTYPSLSKAGGSYLNSALVKMEAKKNGFAEGIALDVDGFVSEGSGENIFVVYRGEVLTPPVSNSILQGITRDTVMELLGERDISVSERAIPREMLYIADELFFTGTAAEITPIRSVDKIEVGNGKRGKLTRQVQEDFFAYVEGRVDDRHGWLTPVHQGRSMLSSQSA